MRRELEQGCTIAYTYGDATTLQYSLKERSVFRGWVKFCCLLFFYVPCCLMVEIIFALSFLVALVFFGSIVSAQQGKDFARGFRLPTTPLALFGVWVVPMTCAHMAFVNATGQVNLCTKVLPTLDSHLCVLSPVDTFWWFSRPLVNRNWILGRTKQEAIETSLNLYRHHEIPASRKWNTFRAKGNGQ